MSQGNSEFDSRSMTPSHWYGQEPVPLIGPISQPVPLDARGNSPGDWSPS